MSSTRYRFYLNGHCIADTKMDKPARIGQNVRLFHEEESREFEIEELYEMNYGYTAVLKEKP